MSLTNSQIAKKWASAIINNDKLLIILGQGINIDAGAPEIRTKSQLWSHYPMFDKMKFFRAQVMSTDLLEKDPELFWYYYGQEYNLYRKLSPNKCYNQLLRICHILKPNKYFALTTNYDEHILNEGFPEDRVFEAHGSINRLQWELPQKWKHMRRMLITDRINIDLKKNMISGIPRWEKCSKIMRPNVLLIQDYQFNNTVHEQQSRNFDKFLISSIKESLTVLEIGVGKSSQL